MSKFFLIILGVLFFASVHAEPRVALVVGNADYPPT